jgi:hypothetical protein
MAYSANIIGEIAAHPLDGAKNKLSKGIKNTANLNRNYIHTSPSYNTACYTKPKILTKCE